MSVIPFRHGDKIAQADFERDKAKRNLSVAKEHLRFVIVGWELGGGTYCHEHVPVDDRPSLTPIAPSPIYFSQARDAKTPYRCVSCFKRLI